MNTYYSRSKAREEAARTDPLAHNLTAEMAGAIIYLRAHPRSVELIRYNAGRGMSRAAMDNIWGRRLVSAVLDNLEMAP